MNSSRVEAEDFSEAELALRAIQNGEVDAIVVRKGETPRLYGLLPAEVPYDHIFEAIEDPAAVLDASGLIAWSTPAYARLLGAGPDELRGTSFRDQLSPADQAGFDDMRTAPRQSTAEAVIRTPAGKTIRVRIGLSPFAADVFPAPGEPEPPVGGYVVVLREIGDDDRVGAVQDQARDLAMDIVNARQEEQARFADEMNAIVLPVLTTMQRDMEWIEERLRWTESRPHSSVFARLGSVRDQLARLAARARRYDPPTVMRLGLAGALEHRARQLRESQGPRVDIHCDIDEPGVPHELALSLYRLVDEILLDLSGPGGATDVSVSITEQDSTIRLETSDNAHGSGASTRARVESALDILRARVADIGGTLEVPADTRFGTTVIVTIPLPKS